MKKISAIALAFVVLPFIGCNTSPSGSGPTGAANDKFHLSGPTKAVAIGIKQGETKDETIKVDRGKDFKADVKFSAEDLPKGFKVEFDPPVVKANEKAETTAKLHAAEDAPLGEATIKVMGKAEPKGESVPLELKVKVEKK